MKEVFTYLAGGGGIVVASVLISVLFEKFTFWHNLDSTLKVVIMMVLSAGIGVGATALLNNPEAWESTEDYLLVVTNTIVAIATNQGWFSKTKELSTK